MMGAALEMRDNLVFALRQELDSIYAGHRVGRMAGMRGADLPYCLKSVQD